MKTEKKILSLNFFFSLQGDFTVEIIQNGTVPLEIYFSGIILSIISFFLSLIPAHFISLYVSSTYRNGKRRVSWYSYCLSQFHGPTSGFLALYCFWTFVMKKKKI